MCASLKPKMSVRSKQQGDFGELLRQANITGRMKIGQIDLQSMDLCSTTADKGQASCDTSPSFNSFKQTNAFYVRE